MTENDYIRQHGALAKFGELALRSNNLEEILSEACRLVAETLTTDLAKAIELQEDRRTLPLIIEHGARALADAAICGSEQQPVLLLNSRWPREFASQDLGFLNLFAHFMAAAMIRLRAIESLESRTRELAELNMRLQRETDERIRAEEALHQAQKIAAVGQITGGLSHDFNNILATISGNIELLSRRVAQGRVAELGHYIEASMAAVNRAVALTQRLLAFSRRQTVDPKVIDLGKVIRGMDDLVRRTLGPFIEIELRLASNLRRVRCDPNQVETALLNLAINARDAMPEGGNLTIESWNVVLPAHNETDPPEPLTNLPSGVYVALSVTDTGQGMSRSVLENALDPFYTTKPIGQGTGLGLSMINGFVQQSGGRLELQSEPGRGTKVLIYFPACSEEHSAPEPD